MEIIPTVSPIIRNMRRLESYVLQGEPMKLNPHTFDGEHRKGEYVESWLLGMRKYF
jgi:hypothetical protein